MHVPDGFINAPVSVAAGAVAAGAVAVSLRGARRELGAVAGRSAGDGSGNPAADAAAAGDRTAPLAGLVAAFIFAVQMLNFPVAAGTSGHLLGGALAAILVGPYTGVLCVSVVLLMQGVLFADGGLTALGVNIVVMGVVTVLVAYGIFRVLVRLLPRGRGGVTVASFAAALVSVPAAAIAFTGIYAVGGTADVALGRVFAAMTGVHVLIGIGEAAITAATVGAVVAVRPDLVHGARDFASRPLELRTAAVAAPGGGTVPPRARPAAGSAADAAGGSVAASATDSSATDSPNGSTTSPEREPGAEAGPGSESASGPGSGSEVEPVTAHTVPARPARTNRGLWIGGLAATVICAGVVSFYASASPDGLEKVAADNGIDKQAEDHAVKDSPLADYGVGGIADPRLSGGLAGVIGAGATLAVGSSVFVAVRRRREGRPGQPEAVGAATSQGGSSGRSGNETA
ncbi:energy-coupling factor ABC transporter permease [Streptomyces sp. WMMB 322]|uniref:energy-coupling factor ABC transporter permease n=1 Tax=Streptomyces sp. WMMB 322 TaxID=1286821 RepID=UPI0006E1BC0D|nr:energy-coupling factor ABC transporter permease [Streptomyces sp. WMMB 322]SCK10110.1 cobalt/nickel transport system permease protein [Streptomyces sp. WMMB 322]